MKEIIKYWWILICFLTVFNVHSQQIGNWFSYLGGLDLSSKYTFHNELQYRNYDFGQLEQFMFRTGIGVNLTEKNNNLLIGYACVLASPSVLSSREDLTQEQRMFQQFTTKQHFGRVYIQHRYRIEERFLPNSFDLRFRYFLSANIALSNKELVDNTLYLSVYNELFISASKENAFDRNRIYGGLGYQFNSKFKLELGMLDQVYQHTHRAQVQVTLFSQL